MNIDPVTVSIATLRLEEGKIDRAAEIGDEEAERIAWEEWNKANDVLRNTEPTSLDGVISALLYIIEEDEDGTDITCFIPTMQAAIRGLRKMRVTA